MVLPHPGYSVFITKDATVKESDSRYVGSSTNVNESVRPIQERGGMKT